MSVLSQLMLHY